LNIPSVRVLKTGCWASTKGKMCIRNYQHDFPATTHTHTLPHTHTFM